MRSMMIFFNTFTLCWSIRTFATNIFLLGKRQEWFHWYTRCALKRKAKHLGYSFLTIGLVPRHISEEKKMFNLYFKRIIKISSGPSIQPISLNFSLNERYLRIDESSSTCLVLKVHSKATFPCTYLMAVFYLKSFFYHITGFNQGKEFVH